MKKILSFFYTDLHWKLISLFLAFVLWVVGSNVNNPHENGSVIVPLNLLNFEILANENIVLLNEDALDVRATVGVRGTRHYLTGLLGAEAYIQEMQVIPSIDFRVIDADAVRSSDGPVTMRLDVSADLYEGLYVRSIRPRYIEVELDMLMRQSFPIEIEILNEVAPNFEMRQVRLEIPRVTITGARSVVSEIDSVWVSVDVLGFHTDSDVPVELMVFDRDGQDITDSVGLSVRETVAMVPVWPVDALELEFEAIGEVATGFAVAEIEFYPQSVDIIATEERLIQLTPLLMSVDLDNANAGIDRRVSVLDYLPDGVYLAHGQSPYVTVTVAVEPIERRTLSVPSDNLRRRGTAALYQVIGEAMPIRITVSGPRSLVSALNPADVGIEIDLRNLAIGTHSVAVSVELPDGITHVPPAPRVQVQIHEPASDEPDDFDPYHVDDPQPQTPIMPPDYVPAEDDNDNDNEPAEDNDNEANDNDNENANDENDEP